MENSTVRRFVVEAGKDAKIDKREAQSLMDMMVASKGVSKREKRSVDAAQDDVRFTDGANDVVAALEAPAAPAGVTSIAALPNDFEAVIPLRDADTSATFNAARVHKDDDGNLPLTFDRLPAQAFDPGDHTLQLDEDGKGRAERKDVGRGSLAALGRPDHWVSTLD